MIIKITIDKPVFKLSLNKDFQHYRRCKVRTFRYNQVTLGQKEICLIIDRMSKKCDLSNNYEYFFMNILAGFPNTVSTYSNQDDKIWDYESDYPESISQLTVTTLIDHQHSNDVSTLNPIILELELE